MDSRDVVVWCSTDRQLARLLVAVSTAKGLSKSPLTVMAPETSECLRVLRSGFGKGVLTDVEIKGIVLPWLPKSVDATEVFKAFAASASPFDVTILLDPNTAVIRPLDEVWELARKNEFVTWSDCSSRRELSEILRRLQGWRQYLPAEGLTSDWCPGTGAIAYRKDTMVLGMWRKLALLGAELPFASDDSLRALLRSDCVDFVRDGRMVLQRSTSGELGEECGIVQFNDGSHAIRNRNGETMFHGSLWHSHFATLESDRASLQLARDAARRDLNLLSFRRPDSGIRRLCPPKLDSKATLVTAVSGDYLDRLKIASSTWHRKPQLACCPLLVFYRDVSPRDLKFLEHLDRHVEFLPWKLNVNHKREEMLSSFVLGAPRYVQSESWIKIDADAFFLDDSPLFSYEDLVADVTGHRWSYTKPAIWLATLDAWAKVNKLCGRSFLSRRQREATRIERTFGHRRFASWLCVHRTEFSREVADLVWPRLPIPSHDTLYWYLAQRLPHRLWNRVNFKSRGAGTSTYVSSIISQIGSAPKPA